jgi:hypothetical protein
MPFAPPTIRKRYATHDFVLVSTRALPEMGEFNPFHVFPSIRRHTVRALVPNSTIFSIINVQWIDLSFTLNPRLWTAVTMGSLFHWFV